MKEKATHVPKTVSSFYLQVQRNILNTGVTFNSLSQLSQLTS